MLKNRIFIFILVGLALAILVAVGFKIFLTNKAETVIDNRLSVINNKDMAKEKIIRPAVVAGSFYPADKSELQAMVENFLAKAVAPAATSTPKIIIVPHAGYTYSGQVAAYSFKQLAGQNITKAIIIGPSHHFPASGLILSSATHWQTPLGSVRLADINQELGQEDNFEINDAIHAPEHSLEIELPFLQSINPDIEIVPIIVGQLTSVQQKEFAQVLARYLDSQTVLIVSVDLAHYHPYQENVALDRQSIDDILALDSAGILQDEIDAPWAVASVLQLAKEQNWQPKLLQYQNSGDVTGDKSQVVGYSAIGFFGSSKVGEQASEQVNQVGKLADQYSEAEKQELLRTARTTLETYFKENKTYQPQTDNSKLQEKRGVFVTLNKAGKLRGCIGYIQPIKPLIEAVRDNAIAAAVEDNRFLPVTADELTDIEIEISILTLPRPDSRENIIKNRSGVVLQQGNRGATYLPQVWEAVEDPDEFFGSLCLKAGLDQSCYQAKETKFSSYQAIVFKE